MQDSKTFRLFISSTFNDFRREREVLQTQVFPHIKEYCSKKGYVFQPIDLRWGVSEEAQLDQKTLELCLDEVRSCKSYPYPNFLLMLGDRYGWIPVPYAIESKEFEEILSHVDENDKEFLLSWYQEDLNQLPTSYILKERSGEYIDYLVWEQVEIRVRSIFQQVVKQTSLTEEQRRKYFLSATEAEIEEGIIPYINPTEYQKRLLQDSPELEMVDTEHIFGFFRDVETESKQSDKYMTDDYYEAKNLKQRVKNELIDANMLHAKTMQLDHESLDEQYLAKFKQSVVLFLESKVDESIAKERHFTPLEIELQAQAYFAKQKRQNFVGQEDILEVIESYIHGDEPQPLILYGTSGRGKSSIIAQAIEEAKTNSSKKLLYRFVGATPHAGSTKEILISLFDELGKDIRDEQEAQGEDQALSSMEDQETFEEFSYRVYDEIQNIEDAIVIIIDAIDQIGHDDQFLWLSSNLPSNVKIVISALDDSKYGEDSKYFQTLKTKSSNLIEVPTFSEPTKLLYALLNQESRISQKHQEAYFLKQYQASASPLYVVVAAQEMRHWRSFDGVVGDTKSDAKIQDLADTQHGIIEEFITSLYTIYHHDERLVKKMLGYIYASRDGLSESELLQLFGVDEAFVKQVAPDTWHENKSGGLPVVVWARLYTQLKSFFSLKERDREALLYFFHREFIDFIEKFSELNNEHETIIGLTQKYIVRVQNNDFSNNRWGLLYLILIAEHNLRYRDDTKLKEFSSLISGLDNILWIDAIIATLKKKAIQYRLYNRTEHAIVYNQIFLYVSQQLYLMDSQKWVFQHTAALNNLALSYQDINNYTLAIDFQEECMHIRKNLYNKNANSWTSQYTESLNNLALSYRYTNQYKKAIELEEESLSILEYFYSNKKYRKEYISALNNLAISYKNTNRLNAAIELEKRSIEIMEPFFREDADYWQENYSKALNNLANSYRSINQTEKAIKLQEENLTIRKYLYRKYPYSWSEYYSVALNNLANSYRNINQVKKAIKLQEENLNIIKKLHKNNPKRWDKQFIVVLTNFANLYQDNMLFDMAIDLQEECLSVVEFLYKDNPNTWIKYYTIAIGNLAQSYSRIRLYEKALELEELNVTVVEPRYKESPNSWAEDYFEVLAALAVSNRNNNNVAETIRLQKECLDISKMFYEQYSKAWASKHFKMITSLALTYKHNDEYEKAADLEIEGLKICRVLYEENPKHWLEDYVSILGFVANTYFNKNLFDGSFTLLDEQYELCLLAYGKEHSKTKEVMANIDYVKKIQKQYSQDKERVKQSLFPTAETKNIHKMWS